jgi:hypothetical protein
MICSARKSLAVGITVASALFCEPIRPCVEVAPHYKVRPDFDVVVQVPARIPLEGIHVVVSKVDKDQIPPDVVIADVLTDKDGLVAFHGIKAGHFWIETKRGEIEGEIAELDVVDSNGLPKVVLAWPYRHIFTAQKIEGTLLRAGIPGVPNLDHDKTLAGVELSLTGALTGLEISKATTDAEGKFAFPAVDTGLYAMYIKWWGSPDYILLDVNTKTKDTEPSRYFINPTDCGLGASKQ